MGNSDKASANVAAGADQIVAGLSAHDLQWAIGIAILASLVFALIEIPRQAKSGLRSCLVAESLLYWVVLAFGNVVTTLLASLTVVKMPAPLAPYYYLLTAFFGVFGFEAILKNTNITMFDKGVLTIQSWIDKALNAAAAAAIDRQEDIRQAQVTLLVQKLNEASETHINTRVLNKMGAGKVESLDAAAKASSADPKLYKILQLVTLLSGSERAALLSGADKIS